MVRLTLQIVIVLSFLEPIPAQELRLKFDSYPPTKETSVGFTVLDGGIVPTTALTGLPLRNVETQDHKYILSVDNQSLGRDRYRRFSFDVYVRSASRQSEVYKYTVSEDPIGPFRDAVSPVAFHVKDGAGEDVGSITLPLHSDNGSDNVALALPKTPPKVRMSGSSTLDLGLTNNLDVLHVQLNNVQISSTGCQSCWLAMTAKPNQSDLAARASTSLIISLRANTVSAFANTLFSLNPDVPHDKLLLSLASTSEQGGIVTPQEFEVPVRFSPPALYLIAVVFIGALVGSIARLLMPPPEAGQQQPQPGQPPQPAPPKKSPTQTIAREVGIAILLAVLIWIIALVAFSYTETRVTVFGLSFDPSQVVPAGIIATLAAAGPTVIARIKEAFGK